MVNHNQSVFIPNRLITDNIILAYESFHYLYKNKSSKKCYVGIMLDMDKAYDRLE